MGRAWAVRRAPSRRIGLAATEVLTTEDRVHPDELELVAGSAPGRRREFATGRWCARLALATVDAGYAGSPPTPLLRDARGAPLWPPGVVGSITHCPGLTAAVAARARSGAGRGTTRGLTGIGIDAEPRARLPHGVLEVVASEGERAALARLGAERPGIPWDVVLFSAKEATYKAWYPLTGLVVGHDAVRVDLSPTGTFTAVAAAPGGAGREVEHRVRGRWALGPRVVVTLGVVP